MIIPYVTLQMWYLHQGLKIRSEPDEMSGSYLSSEGPILDLTHIGERSRG